MDFGFITLPSANKLGYWNSKNRSLDPVQNWREFWEQQLLAYGGTVANKDLTGIELEALDLILIAVGESYPLRQSLYDDRKLFYKWVCGLLGLSQEDQLGALFERCFGIRVWEPLKYTAGSNSIFHCGFNNYATEENSLTLPIVTAARALFITIISDKSYCGLISASEELYEWNYSLSVPADWTALTVRAIMNFNNVGALTVGPTMGGNAINTEGVWVVSKAADNKINFSIHDGTNLITIESDGTHNNEVVEIYAIVDGTATKMYIDEVLQADVGTIIAAPDVYSEDAVFVGDDISSNDFKGTIYEIAIDAEVITP